MFRAAHKWSWLTALAVVAGTMAVGPAAWAGYVTEGQNEGTDVVVSDNAFSQPRITADVGESVWFQLAADAKNEHQLAFDNRPGVAIVRYIPGKPKYQRNYFAHFEAGVYAYYCLIHGAPGGQGMSGVLNVVEPVKMTTSAASPTTATTARLAPATTTTKPAAQTTASTTAQPAGSGASKATTTTTLPLAAIPLPAAQPTATDAPPAPAVEGQDPEVTATLLEAEEAAFHTPGEEDDPDGSGTMMLILAVGLFLGLLGGAGGWSWYHRSSRYQPA